MYDDDLKANYRQLKAERGWTWGQVAQYVGSTDRELAAWFREQAADETPQQTRTPPGRTGRPAVTAKGNVS